MKALITGVTGTGKSTISKALKERGVSSIDFKEISKDLCFWRDKKTKEKVEYSPINTAEWFDSNERVCDVKKLKEFLNQHENLVVTGVASGNQTEYLNLFDKVFLLQCSPEILLHRLQTRSVVYGKTKAEQDQAIEWQKTFDPQMLSHGAIPINNEGSANDTAEQIIAKIYE